MKRLLQDLCVTIAYNICAFLVGLIICSVFMHLDFLRGSVFIYYFRMLLYCLLSAFITVLAALILTQTKIGKKFAAIEAKMVFAGFALSFFLINYVTGFAFNNERSYTIYSLGYLYDNADRSFSQEEMEQVFIEGFVVEFGATKKRIDEQMHTGYIEQTNGRYRISASGKRFIELMRFFDIFFPTATNPSSLYPNGNPKRRVVEN